MVQTGAGSASRKRKPSDVLASRSSPLRQPGAGGADVSVGVSIFEGRDEAQSHSNLAARDDPKHPDASPPRGTPPSIPGGVALGALAASNNAASSIPSALAAFAPIDHGEPRAPPKKELKSVFIHVPPGQQLGLALKLSEGKGAEIMGIKPVCPISGNVHVGDIIVAIDGKPITSRKDFGVGTGRFRVFQIDREATDRSNVPIIEVKKRREILRTKTDVAYSTLPLRKRPQPIAALEAAQHSYSGGGSSPAVAPEAPAPSRESHNPSHAPPTEEQLTAGGCLDGCDQPGCDPADPAASWNSAFSSFIPHSTSDASSHAIGQPRRAIVVATKPSKDAKLGLFLEKNTEPVRITSISSDGLFAGSDLEEGMVLESVNGKAVVSYKGCLKFLKEAEGQVTVVATADAAAVEENVDEAMANQGKEYCACGKGRPIVSDGVCWKCWTRSTSTAPATVVADNNDTALRTAPVTARTAPEDAELKEVFGWKYLMHSLMPKECMTKGCRNKACSKWVPIHDKENPWYSCLDCQENDYGGWPDAESGQLPIKHLTQANREAIKDKCSTQDEPAMPNLPSRAPRPICDAPGCPNQAFVGGKCGSHGERPMCDVAGCPNWVVTGKKCWSHGERPMRDVAGCPNQARTGKKCWSHAEHAICDVAGCPNQAFKDGLCGSHGGRPMCDVAGCPNRARMGKKCDSHFAYPNGKLAYILGTIKDCQRGVVAAVVPEWDSENDVPLAGFDDVVDKCFALGMKHKQIVHFLRDKAYTEPLNWASRKNDRSLQRLINAVSKARRKDVICKYTKPESREKPTSDAHDKAQEATARLLKCCGIENADELAAVVRRNCESAM